MPIAFGAVDKHGVFGQSVNIGLCMGVNMKGQIRLKFPYYFMNFHVGKSGVFSRVFPADSLNADFYYLFVTVETAKTSPPITSRLTGLIPTAHTPLFSAKSKYLSEKSILFSLHTHSFPK